MGLVFLLFLDLATIPQPAVHGAANEDVAVYQQALADLKVRGDHTVAETTVSQRCAKLGESASELRRDTLADYRERNRATRRLSEETLEKIWGSAMNRQEEDVKVSSVGSSRDGNQAWLEVNLDDGMRGQHDVHCLLYRRAAARFRLQRDLRQPDLQK